MTTPVKYLCAGLAIPLIPFALVCGVLWLIGWEVAVWRAARRVK